SEALDKFFGHFENRHENREALQVTIQGVLDHRQEIDQLIESQAKNWQVYRISPVDRNLLRLSIYEMLFAHEPTPAQVIINEAVEVAKKFGNEETPRFINGILDAVYKAKQS